MLIKKGVWPLLFGLFLTMLLVACGGGGGGGGIVVPASYDGETAPAVITDQNATAIVQGAWENLFASQGAGDVIPLSASATASTTQPANTEIVALQTVQEAILAATDSGTLFGGCGGFANYTINLNVNTGAFNGQIDFQSYCDIGVTLTGTSNFSGRIDPNLLVITRMQMTFNMVNMVDVSGSNTIMEGTMGYVLDPDLEGETDNFNLVIRDEATLKTYWICQYVLRADYGLTSDILTLTGRYYDFESGYVKITTQTPLVFTNAPIAGVLLFTSDSCQARLTFNADQTMLLEVDADGDGVFETTIPNPF